MVTKAPIAAMVAAVVAYFHADPLITKYPAIIQKMKVMMNLHSQCLVRAESVVKIKKEEVVLVENAENQVKNLTENQKEEQIKVVEDDNKLF